MVLKMMLRQFLYTKNKPSADQFEKYLEGTIKQRNLIDINYALMRFNISNDFNGVVQGTGEVEKSRFLLWLFKEMKIRWFQQEMHLTSQKA